MSAIAVGLQDEFRTALERLIGAWFPRIVDTLHGGYLCDFAHKWRNRGAILKMLEFQARSLCFVARASVDDPSSAECGLSFLADVMWDEEYG